MARRSAASGRVVGIGWRRRAEQLVLQRPGGGDDRQAALHRPPGQHARNQQPVDLVGPFEDPVDPGVPKVALGRVVPHVSVPAMDLDVLVEDEIRASRSRPPWRSRLRWRIPRAPRARPRRWTHRAAPHRCARRSGRRSDRPGSRRRRRARSSRRACDGSRRSSRSAARTAAARRRRRPPRGSRTARRRCSSAPSLKRPKFSTLKATL